MASWKRWLLYLVLLGVLPLGGYGLFANFRDGTVTTPSLGEDLVQPYAQLVSRGEWSEAYQRFTSKEFQKQWSYKAYARFQEENRKEFGPLIALSQKVNDPFRSSFDLFSWKKYYRGGLVYQGQTEETWVTWEVVLEDGLPKIDAMYQQFHKRLTPRIF